MLYENRDRFKGISIKIGMIFSKIPLTPNMWTVSSLVPAAISAYLLADSQFLLAAVFFAMAAFIDFIDGSVARVTGRATKFGAYLDTITDRYVEFILIAGLFFAGLPSLRIIPSLEIGAGTFLLFYLFGSTMTTYAKAAAREKELFEEGELKGGILERAERLILLFAGILFASISTIYLSGILAILAVMSNATALQRIMKAAKAAGKS